MNRNLAFSLLASFLMLAFVSPSRGDDALFFDYGEQGNPPFFYINDDGDFTGAAVDVLDVFFRPRGYELIPVTLPNKRLEVMFQRGRIDLSIIADKWLEPEASVVFSKPFTPYKQVLFSYGGFPVSPRSAFLSRLEQGKVCTRMGWQYNGNTGELPLEFNRVDATSTKGQIRMLALRRCDLLVGEEYNIRWLLTELGLDRVITSTGVVSDLIMLPVALSVRYEHLLGELNAFLSEHSTKVMFQERLDYHMSQVRPQELDNS